MNQEADNVHEGISVIVSTNRSHCIKNVFENYSRQTWPVKELIIILNNDLMNLEQWIEEAMKYESVSIFKLPGRVTLGKCLNYGVKKAKYNYIAKLDDDDYYGPQYLTEAIETLKRLNADVVGKRTCFMYLANEKELRLRFSGQENCKVSILQGATIFTHKKVLQLIPFPDKNLGECYHFLKRCRKKKFRIRSSSRYNFVMIRNEDNGHTWHPTNEYLNETSERVSFSEDFTSIVDYAETPADLEVK